MHVKDRLGKAVEAFFYQICVSEEMPEVDELHVVFKVMLAFGLIQAKG